MSQYQVPDIRIRRLNDVPWNRPGDYVLYWMIAQRRPQYNFALDRAIEICREMDKPLVVLEALRCDYRWASDRLHLFVIQGMADNAAKLARSGIRYYPYIERQRHAGRGLLAALAERSAAVVTDDYPCFFLPRMIAAAARRIDRAMEAVDSNGLLPLRAADRDFSRAFSFRRFLQQQLPDHLHEFPKQKPFRGTSGLDGATIPRSVISRWPAVTGKELDDPAAWLDRLPIDHHVPSADFRGGHIAAGEQLDAFLKHRFERYGDGRNHPDDDTASGLSPYLHFGHLSPHEVFARLAEREKWHPGQLTNKPNGSRNGWWQMSETAEAFLDELITWRELGFNMGSQRDDYDRYESLPKWARETLEQHAGDQREAIYSLEQLERAETHDEVWNAAQRQLVREGRMQNYLRMLWGKKVLEWTRHPREALAVLIELNNKYAVDGRDPNSYSGIFWVFGRYDRAWGPERPIYGKIRYMSSDNTVRKLRMSNYLKQYGPDVARQQDLFTEE